MSELQEKITKINTLITNHTNDINGINKTINEYKNKPSTVNLKKIAGLNTDIGRRQGLIKYYRQQLKKLKETKKQVEGGVESIEEEKEREEEKEEEKEREEEKEEEKEEETGFRETLVPNKNVSTGTINPNRKLCPQIFNIGKKVNNKFFIPSQFPNLTKKKSLFKRERKHMKTKNKNRKEISRTDISKKEISKKEISKTDISKKEISKKEKKSVKNN